MVTSSVSDPLVLIVRATISLALLTAVSTLMTPLFTPFSGHFLLLLCAHSLGMEITCRRKPATYELSMDIICNKLLVLFKK